MRGDQRVEVLGLVGLLEQPAPRRRQHLRRNIVPSQFRGFEGVETSGCSNTCIPHREVVCVGVLRIIFQLGAHRYARASRVDRQGEGARG